MGEHIGFSGVQDLMNFQSDTGLSVQQHRRHALKRMRVYLLLLQGLGDPSPLPGVNLTGRKSVLVSPSSQVSATPDVLAPVTFAVSASAGDGGAAGITPPGTRGSVRGRWPCSAKFGWL